MNQKAVSQVVAALLLIALAVAAAIIVYVYSVGLLGQMQTAGGTQMKETVIMEAYNWQTPSVAVLTIRNTGSTPVQIADVFLNGVASTVTIGGCSNPPGMIQPESSCTLTITTGSSGTIQGEAYPVKVVSANGAIFTFELIDGQTN